MIITLTRFAYLPKGVLGRFSLGNDVYYTLERPWKNNERNISCIPEGSYRLRWDTEGRVHNVPELVGVVGRTFINIHVANEPDELHGCIAPGAHFSIKDNYPRVHKSREALEALIDELGYGFSDGEHGILITHYEAVLNG